MNSKLLIKYLNNDGGGFAETCEVETGCTVQQFLQSKGIEPHQYTIRLRRHGANGCATSETPTAHTELQADDFISCVPLKAEGAVLACSPEN